MLSSSASFRPLKGTTHFNTYTWNDIDLNEESLAQLKMGLDHKATGW